jgi:hypothetical protein
MDGKVYTLVVCEQCNIISDIMYNMSGIACGAVPGKPPHSTATPHPYDVIHLSLYKASTLSTELVSKAAAAALYYTVLTAS